jgi:tRNA nucleotidyltransferase (CCA-adding enzyme)
MQRIEIPESAAAVLRTLEKAGFEAYAVGGCCRDALLGRTPSDWDVCTSARPDEIQRLFEKTIPTGVRHGTVTVRYGSALIEVTTYRVDGDYPDHRRPAAVRFTDNLRADLARRDFTMNALAADVRGEVVDYFGGAEDIRRGVIRCVGDAAQRFEEDALRMFRAIRFSAQLGFALEDSLLTAARQLAHTAQYIAAERVYAETMKALRAACPDRLETGFALGLYDHLLSPGPAPELHRLPAFPPETRLAAFCAALRADGRISSAADFLRALRATSAQIRACGAILDPEPVWVRRNTLPAIAAAVGRQNALSAAAAMEISAFPGALEDMTALLQEDRCLSVDELAVSGRDVIALGYSGPTVGAAMEKLLNHVLDHPEDNNRAALLSLLKQ